MFEDFEQKGKASCICGGQFGSESKGSGSAYVALKLAEQGRFFGIVTGNMAAQSGHTSIHNGVTRVLYHIPTAPVIAQQVLGRASGGVVYLNAGSIIDVEILKKELELYDGRLYIHPNAAVITDECKEAEGRADSAQTKIASTRKGVGEALSRKVLRSGQVASDHPFLSKFVRNMDLNEHMKQGKSVLVEVPQGVSLSLNHSSFYPYTTSRDCTPSSAFGDANIHPTFYNDTMVVLRTFPIRVGNIVENGELKGQSGSCYTDQHELSWSDIGVDAEITTVTKRVRRVFTFSKQQVKDTFRICRPGYVFLTFCNYVKKSEDLIEIVWAINEAAKDADMPLPKIVFQWGATTEDAGEEYAMDN